VAKAKLRRLLKHKRFSGPHVQAGEPRGDAEPSAERVMVGASMAHGQYGIQVSAGGDQRAGAIEKWDSRRR
jgi:hypothetical protein